MIVADIVNEVETSGVVFRMQGEKVRVRYPDEERRAEVAQQIALLRARRTEVIECLKARWSTPAMPGGVRLIRWEPKLPPLALTRVEIVTDVHKFVTLTLVALNAAMAGERWLAGNRSVRELVERLEECGVVVEVIEGTRT